VAVWIALGAAAFFIVQSEKQIAVRAAAFRIFDQHAREAAMSLGDVRAAQQAYVAAGQDNTFWMPKVASTTDDTTAVLRALRDTAADAGARTALDQASNTIALFRDIDVRAREYVKGEQPLMAADVIFTEGGEAASTAARSVEGARLAERQAMDAEDAAARKREALALGAAGGCAALITLLLMPIGRGREAGGDVAEETEADIRSRVLDLEEWAGPAKPAAKMPQETASTAPAAAPALPAAPATPAQPAAQSPTASAAQTMIKSAADLATDFGRVRDLEDLQRLLGRVAAAMEATGVLVWVGSVSGEDLRPLIAHGYNEQTLARIAPVARTDTNAAAAAYRSGQLQIVVSKPGVNGALVAPILVPGGCIGAFSAEFRGAETSETVQAFTTIVAGYLATVLGTSPADSVEPAAAAQA
jgi:hypothetical protein